MSNLKTLNKELPLELQKLIHEYDLPIHRKPLHGIIMTKIFNTLKKPIVNKIHNLTNENSKNNYLKDELQNKELGEFFDNPSQFLQVNNKTFLNRFNHNQLSSILNRTKKILNCKKMSPIVKVTSIFKIVNNKISLNKFTNNNQLMESRINLLYHNINNDLYIENPEQNYLRGKELTFLVKKLFMNKLKHSSTKKNKQKIVRQYKNADYNVSLVVYPGIYALSGEQSTQNIEYHIRFIKDNRRYSRYIRNNLFKKNKCKSFNINKKSTIRYKYNNQKRR